MVLSVGVSRDSTQIFSSTSQLRFTGQGSSTIPQVPRPAVNCKPSVPDMRTNSRLLSVYSTQCLRLFICVLLLYGKVLVFEFLVLVVGGYVLLYCTVSEYVDPVFFAAHACIDAG